jgi:hypothetical protein
MPKIKDNDLVLARRMQEFCRPPTAWNRCLWGVSLQTTLRDVLEACEIRRHGILSDQSVLDLQHSAAIAIGTDVGGGSEKTRRQLQQLLAGKIVVTPGSLAAETTAFCVEDLNKKYLQRWAVAVRGGVSDALIERCARSVISHLVDLGHSPTKVSAHIQKVAISSAATASNAESLLTELESLHIENVSRFEGVFPIRRAPMSRTTNSFSWLNGSEVKEWIAKNGVAELEEGERICGGVKILVDARDVDAAISLAFSKFETTRNRAVLVQKQPIESLPFFWITGRKAKVPISGRQRGVEVASLARQDRIYTLGEDEPRIERAISLLAELEHGPPSSAVTSGWAAMESLSMGPAEDGNRVEAAVRMAYLVAASFARAELTTLAYSYAKSNKDALASQIDLANSNREKTELILRQLIEKSRLSFNRIEDTASAIRMRRLISDPVGTLSAVERYVETTFKRFYRLRNLIAHGGRTDSIVLDAGLRVAAPLIGAAFDRIHHASATQNLSPMELIARAKLRIAALDARRPLDLLGLLD